MKKLWRIMRRLLLLVLAFVLLLAIASFVPRSCSNAAPCDEGTVEIGVVNHGYHTGLLVPFASLPREWRSSFTFFDREPQYLEFGWGDSAYYMARTESIDLALRALFTPTGSVMHVVAIHNAPVRVYDASDMKFVRVCEDRFLNLTTYMADSFRLDVQGVPRYLDVGLFGTSSAFYEAHGTYHFLYTCNSWIASALDIAGADAPLWGGVAQSIMWHL